MKKLRIFAASPGDMASERAKVETVAALLKPLADHLGIVLEVVDWRAVVPDMGRPEQVILDQLKPSSWDVLIGMLWHRFGTPPGGTDPQTQRMYLSGTEEEFRVAFRLWQQFGTPRIMIYRCTRAIPPDALDLDQFKRVKQFFAEFEAIGGEHPGLYQSFETTEAFETLLLDNLQKLLIAYGEQTSGQPVAADVIQSLTPRPPDNLPRRAPFFGRKREIDLTLRALSPEDRTWGVLLDGIGGIGKTSLAVEVAYLCKERGLFDAFIFVSAKQNLLAPGGIRELTPAARTLDEFLNETARILGETGIPQLGSNDKRRALLDALRSTRALLLYDNLETLSQDEQEALADFLRELPSGCKAITTSRRRGGEGAVWLRMEKLDWEGARAIIQNEMGRDSQLARKLTSAGEARWPELYDETRGSPLALMHVLGLMRVRASLTLNGALELLRGNHDPDLERFIFQEARRDLTSNDQTALGALSFFASSADFEVWMDIAGLSLNALETTIDRLSALSLVDLLPEDRYELHPLTRNFVRDELLADRQIARSLGWRFSWYWVAYARHYGKESYQTFDRLEAEWANLEATANWLWQTTTLEGDNVGDQDAALMLNNLLLDLNSFLVFVGRWDERIHWNMHLYKVMSVMGYWRVAGRWAYQVAWLHYNRTDTELMVHWTNRCIEAWKHSGTEYQQATQLRLKGLMARQRKDYTTAEHYYKEMLGILRELKSERGIVIVLLELGALAQECEQYDTAEKYYCEALNLIRNSDDQESQGTCFNKLGGLALDREHWEEARTWFEQALQSLQEVGQHARIATAQHGLARVHEAEGQPELALPLAQKALAIHERLRFRDLAKTRTLVERLRAAVGEQ